MTVQTQRHRMAAKRPAKKSRSLASSEGVSVVFAVGIGFKRKSIMVSHSNLRNWTFQHHPGKLYKASGPRQPGTTRQRHGVELTDDVIVIGRDGRRVPPPTYAMLRIDQLSLFRKD